jgi:hypothetical protein
MSKNSKSMVKLLIPLLIGSLLSCSLSIGIVKLQLNSKVAILPEKINKYQKDSMPIVTKDLNEVKFKDILKYSAIPFCLSFIIFGIVIYFVTKKPSTQTEMDA